MVIIRDGFLISEDTNNDTCGIDDWGTCSADSWVICGCDDRCGCDD